MQFAVPQFTDVEDKIIGPLTLKQFLALLGTGGLVMALWSMNLPGVLFFPLAFIFGGAGIGITFGKYNGRPLFSYVLPFISFMSTPKILVFRREPGDIIVSNNEIKKNAQNLQAEVIEAEPAESRLKKLAYLLDKKTEEQKEIANKNVR